MRNLNSTYDDDPDDESNSAAGLRYEVANIYSTDGDSFYINYGMPCSSVGRAQ